MSNNFGGASASSIAFIGPKHLVNPLAAAGVEVFPCDSTLQSRQKLANLAARREHGIVFIIERYATELKSEIEAAEAKGLNILLLPDHRGRVGLFQERLRNLMKKATGAAQI